jgi:zinc protease
MRSEDSPTGLFWEEIYASAFKVAPYHWPVIGWMSDLFSLQATDVSDYYRLYYAPNNAVLVLVGDFNTEKMLDAVRTHFGPLPRAPDPPAVRSVEPEQKVPRRVTFRSPKTNLAHVVYAYHVPEAANADAPTLSLLETILGSGRDNRLDKAFVETGLGVSASADYDISRDPSLFSFSIEVMPGVDTDKIEAELQKQIDALKTDLVSDYELQRAKNRFLGDEIFENQTVSSYGMKIGWFEVAGGDYRLLDTMLQKSQTVTKEDIQTLCRKYFVDTNLTSGVLLPEPGAAATAGDDEGGGGMVHRSATRPGRVAHRSDAPHKAHPAKGKRIAKPAPAMPAGGAIADKVKKTILPNGLTLIVLENHAFPTVYVHGIIRGGGAASDPKNKEGIGALTAASMRRGTATRSYDDINRALEFVDADISFGAGVESLVFRAHFLSKDINVGTDLLTDILLHPSFPEDGVNKERELQVAGLEDEAKNNRQQAWYTYTALLYGDHPYGRRVSGLKGAVERLTRADAEAFYRANYRPDRTVIAVVGDVDAASVIATLSKSLGGWKAPDRKPFGIPAPPALGRTLTKTYAMPEKAQCVLYLGEPSVPRNNPDYDAFSLLTDILAGSDLTSRLYKSVREKEGLVYYVYGYDSPRTMGNAFQFTAGAAPENVDRVVELIRNEIPRIRNTPVDPQELDDAKSFVTGNRALELETYAALADRLANLHYFGLPFSDIDTYTTRIQKLSAADLMRVAKKYLNPDIYVLGIAGPTPGGRKSNAPK